MGKTIAVSRGEELLPAATGESAVEDFIGIELNKSHRARGRFGVSHPAGPLPLIIGVTGHRDLRTEDIPKLESTLRDEFLRLRKRYPSTPFVLLSALADGADRLAARIAMEAGMRLVVVLPMPVSLYETDFDAASREEFRSLLTSAEHSFELPIVEGIAMEEVVEHGPARERQYAQAGAYLATHSAVLFALWDGVILHKVGGTSQIVRFKLEGVPVPYARAHSQLDAPDSGPVYHLMTPRRSNPRPVGHPFTLHRLYPAGYGPRQEAEHDFDDIYDRMETFNQDAIRYAEDLREHRRNSEEYIFPSPAHHAMPTPLRELREFYAIADVLSQRFQKRTLAILKLLLTFVFFAALFFELYSSLFEETPMIALYLGMFVCAFACYKWADRKGYQTRYLDYRALAERLRVQFFWKLAGIEESVADYYLRKQRSELEWIRNAVRSCMTETCADTTPLRSSTDTERLRFVQKHWVEDQAKYFSRAAHRDHEQLHAQEKKVTFLFGLALTLAVIQVALGYVSQVLMLCIGVLPVAAALLNHYLEKNALAQHKRQYTRMSIFYNRAKQHLASLISESRLTEAQSFLAELGREALAENGDWILTHRDRPLEVPKGG